MCSKITTSMKKQTTVLLTTLLAFLGEATMADEIWITPVGTGPGSGTAADPYVCSSATSFDSLIPTIATNSTIHLMAGTFATEGMVIVPNACKLRGAGIDITTVRLIDNFQGFATRFFGVNPTQIGQGYQIIACQGDGAEVSDLTVDCNLQNQNYSTSDGTNTYTGICIEAVQLLGKNLKISRAKAINWGTTAPVECLIFFESPWNNGMAGTNFLIEDCIVTHPAPVSFQNGADGFIIGGQGDQGAQTNIAGANWVIGGEVRNCRAFDIGIGSFGNPNYFNGIGFGGNVYGEKIDGNMFINVCGQNVMSSCLSVVDGVIENNMFLNVAQVGIGFQGEDACNQASYPSIKRNIKISDNFITVQTGGKAMSLAGLCMQNGQSCQQIEGLDIENNFIKAADGSGPIEAVDVTNATDLIIKNNTLDANGGSTFLIDGSSVQISQINNNQNLAGAPVSPAGWVTTNIVDGSINVPAGMAYQYNGVNMAYGITSLYDYFFGSAGNFTMTGTGNVGLGFQTLSSGTTGNGNVGLGYQALSSDTAGGGNVALGYQALSSDTTNGLDVAIGYEALQYSMGQLNIGIGPWALYDNISGNGNVAIGPTSLQDSTTSDNTGIGCFALQRQTTGSANTALGFNTMSYTTNGNENIAIGSSAGQYNYSGNGNVIVGTGSGQSFNSSYNILLGTGVEAPLPDTGSQMNIGGVIFGNGLKNTDADNATPYAGHIGLFTTNLTSANFTVNGTTLLNNNVTVLGTNSAQYFSGNGGGLTNITFTLFTSPQFTLPAAGVGGVVANVAHGFSNTPTFVRWVLVCKTNNFGYTVGDEVDVNSVINGQPWVFSNGASSTNVFLIMNGTGIPAFINKTNFNSVQFTLADWKAKCYARP